MANEVELKLRIAAPDIPRLKRHPAIKAAMVGKPRTCNLVSNYFDTPQLALLDLGISLRVRRMSGNWIQAINSTGKSLVGVHQRMEWEDIIAFDHPDFSKITEPALTRIFDEETLRSTLDSIFRIKLRRTEWQLAFDNGDQIELAFEVGELVVAKMHELI